MCSPRNILHHAGWREIMFEFDESIEQIGQDQGDRGWWRGEQCRQHHDLAANVEGVEFIVANTDAQALKAQQRRR